MVGNPFLVSVIGTEVEYEGLSPPYATCNEDADSKPTPDQCKILTPDRKSVV